MSARVIFVALGIALVGCKTQYADPVTNEDLDVELSICPRAEPQLYSSCVDRVAETTQAPLTPRCEYGSSADLGCNDQLGCIVADAKLSTGPFWRAVPALAALGCAMNHCPGARADITDGARCDAPMSQTEIPVPEYVCAYAEGTCGCSAGATGFTWTCVPPPSAPCPPTRPLIGQACDDDGLTCDYGACVFEHSAAVVCAEYRWQLAAVACN
jgi:hypothetical protein